MFLHRKAPAGGVHRASAFSEHVEVERKKI
jgi:hypothetical protein